MEQPNYYAIIPATVRYDNDLSDKAKLIYGEIVALSNKTNECWASNQYFSELYNVSTETISRLITKLIKKGYLERQIIYKNGSKEIDKRILTPIDKNVNTYCQKYQGGIDKNVKENNTSINNIINNINIIYNWEDDETCDFVTKNKSVCLRRSTYKINGKNYCNQHSKPIISKLLGETNTTKKGFEKPTLTDIEDYINEEGYYMSAEAFYDFYESKNWYVGKNKMKDWKAAVRNWNRNQTNKKPKYNDGTFKVDRSRIINP